MTCEPDEFLAYYTHLRAEHRKLNQRIHQIEDEWTSGSDQLTQVIDDVETLRDELMRHFLEEETGGCLDEAVSRLPRLGHDADRLIEEHAELRENLDQLLAKLETSQLKKRITEAQEDFHRFAVKIREHEMSENRILEEGFGIKME